MGGSRQRTAHPCTATWKRNYSGKYNMRRMHRHFKRQTENEVPHPQVFFAFGF
jgi:hypothetical protein